jgi:hypothetical protein
VIITGGSIFDGTTLHTVADATLSVHATSLNYIYLACGLTKTTVDSYVSGGTVAPPAIATIATSTQANTNTAGLHPALHLAGGCAGGSRRISPMLVSCCKSAAAAWEMSPLTGGATDPWIFLHPAISTLQT